MSISESRRILRRLELEAYACVITALRAQGHLSLEKKSVLTQLSQQLSISTERHHAEVRRAICDDDLCYIADCVSGTESRDSWLPEAKRLGRGNPKLVARHSLSSSTQAQALTALGLGGTRLGGGVSAKTDHTENTTDKKLPAQVQSALKIVLASHPNVTSSTTKPKVQVTSSVPSPAPPPAPPIPSPAPTPSPSTAPVSSPVAVVMCSIGSQTDPPIPPPTRHTDSIGVQVDLKSDGVEPEKKMDESIEEEGVVNKVTVVTEKEVDPPVEDSQKDTPMEVGGVSEVVKETPILVKHLPFLSSGDPVMLKESPSLITRSNHPLKRSLDNESIDTPPSKILKTGEGDDPIMDNPPSNTDHTPLSHYSGTDMSHNTVTMVTEADQSVKSKPLTSSTPVTTIPLAPPTPPVSNMQTTPTAPADILTTPTAPPPTYQEHVPISTTSSTITSSHDATPTPVSMTTTPLNANTPITVASSVSQVSSSAIHTASTVNTTTAITSVIQASTLPLDGRVVGGPDRSDSSFDSQSNPPDYVVATGMSLASEPLSGTSSLVTVTTNNPLELDKPVIPDTSSIEPLSIQSSTQTIPMLSSSEPPLQSIDQQLVSPSVTPLVSIPSGKALASFDPLSITDAFPVPSSSSVSTLGCPQSDLVSSVATSLTSFLPVVSASVVSSASTINTLTSSIDLPQAVSHDFTPSIDLEPSTINLGTPAINLGTPAINLGTPAINLGTPDINLGTPAISLGTPAINLGTPAINLGTPAINLGTPAISLGTPAINLGTPAINLGTPDINLRTPAISLGTPDINLGTPDINLGTPDINLGTPAINLGTPAINIGSPAINLGTPDIATTTTRPPDLIPPSVQPLALSIDLNSSTIIESPSLVPATLGAPTIHPLPIIQPPPSLGINLTVNPPIMGPPSVEPPSIHSIFSFPSPLTSVIGDSPLQDSSSSLAGTPIDEGDLLATVTSELGVESIDPSLLNMSDLLSFLPSDDMTLADLALTGGEISSDMVVLQEGVAGKTPVDFGRLPGKLEGLGKESGVVATTPESILEDVPLEIKDTVEAILKSQTDLDTI